MVPLVGGRWAEAKTLAIGTLVADAAEPRAQDISYFSRLTDHETFRRLALVETHRRGTEAAGVVVAVMDGAEWLQGLLDFHRPDAVRVLDFPHAVSYLAVAAQEAFGHGTATASEWLAVQAHHLKHEDPTSVLAAVDALPPGPARETALGYLGPRLAQLRYAEFRAAGYPIGSGMVEGANKLVVEARLKGSGMHWAPAQVDPMLALRNVVCNDRWAEAWPRITARLRAAARERRHRRAQARRATLAALPTSAPPPNAPPASLAAPPLRSPTIINGRPTKAHPGNRRFLPLRADAG